MLVRMFWFLSVPTVKSKMQNIPHFVFIKKPYSRVQMFCQGNIRSYSSLRYKWVKTGACLKILFYLSCCNGEMLPLETHIFAYKLYNSAYVLIYEHVCTFSKCSCRFCGCCADLAKSWSQLRQVWDELVAAIQHCEKEKGKVKIITVFTRTDKKKNQATSFYDKAVQKTGVLGSKCFCYTGHNPFLTRFLLQRASLSPLVEKVFPAFYNGLLECMQSWNGREDFWTFPTFKK